MATLGNALSSEEKHEEKHEKRVKELYEVGYRVVPFCPPRA
jgi:hypothetical protein